MKKIWKNLCACSLALACSAGLTACGDGDVPVSVDLDGDGVVSSWEIGTGVPDAYYLPTLAKALNVSVADICGAENTKSEDALLIDAFHNADEVTQKNVRLLLGLGGSDHVDQ